MSSDTTATPEVRTGSPATPSPTPGILADTDSDRRRLAGMARKVTAPVSYGEYLKVPQLLSLQHPLSGEAGEEAHDEHLFIVIHQTYELWFKQVLHELGSIVRIFESGNVPETSMFTIVHRLTRVCEILRVLVSQISILETMSPLDFLEFRDVLFPASGFQSVQFRIVEDRMSYGQKGYCAYLNGADAEQVKAAEAKRSLFDLVERWLERTPFLEMGDFQFWKSYEASVDHMLAQDEASLRAMAPSEDVLASQLEYLHTTRKHFDSVLDEAHYNEMRERKEKRLSFKAMQAALFITLYHEEPIFHLPFQMLSLIGEVDKLFTQWRYRHAIMVHGMLGVKMGTGGSSGYFYLKASAERHQIFTDLLNMSTFLIPKYAVPPLPAPVVRAMRSFYTEQQAAADSARAATPAAAAGRAGAGGAGAASAGSPPPVSALPPGHPSVPTDAPKCPYAHAH